MTLVLCVDDRGGLSFNGRRQSQDRLLREDLLQEAAGCRLWMTSYSRAQFSADTTSILTAEDPLSKAMDNDFCFLETLPSVPVHIKRLLLYRWNRIYPSDQFFLLPTGLSLLRREEFPGFSHARITKELYIQ